jgi:3-isopropylmalate/(R)-2-methylmalate dehydratase small subunit
MKRVSKRGLSTGLFAAWRYSDRINRIPDPEFVLNQQVYQGTSILLGGQNFGCGSSREHAVWALDEYGIRVIIAPSFGAIFSANCVANGLLPARLSEADINNLAEWVRKDPQNNLLEVDLADRMVKTTSGQEFKFEVLDADAEMLMQGLDPIAMTLLQLEEIESFEQNSFSQRPWAKLARTK